MADRLSLAQPISVAAEPFDGADSKALRRELASGLWTRYAGDAEIERMYAGHPASCCFERALAS